MIPTLTIPESAFDPGGYTSRGRRSPLLRFLFGLTNGSALLLTVLYIISYLGLKPLMQLTASRRLELLEAYRARLRDFYLNIVGRVNYIPIVAINKHDGSGKLYADAVCQTGRSYLEKHAVKTNEELLEELEENDRLSQAKLASKLGGLSDALNKCTSYTVGEMPHYASTRESLKSFQHKVDTEMFSYDEMFTVADGDKKRNLVVDTKNDIRSIKGLYMSGKA